MFLRRRRPLMRAAVVGGAAYHMGKRRANDEATDAMQDQQIADMQASQQAGNGGYAAPAPQADITSQLSKLSELKASGVLSQQEFDAAKQKLLGA